MSAKIAAESYQGFSSISNPLLKSWGHLSVARNNGLWQTRSHNSLKKREWMWWWGAWLARHSKLGLGWVSCSVVLQKQRLWENLSGMFTGCADSLWGWREQQHRAVCFGGGAFVWGREGWLVGEICWICFWYRKNWEMAWENKVIGKFVFLFNSKNSGHGFGMLLLSCRLIFIHYHLQTQAVSQLSSNYIGNFHCYEISTGRLHIFVSQLGVGNTYYPLYL